MKIFVTSFLVMLVGQTAYSFPIWGLCRVRFVQCFDKEYKKEPCYLLDNTQTIVVDSKNVVVRIYRVSTKYAWISTGPMVLIGGTDHMRKVPESSCRPLFRARKK